MELLLFLVSRQNHSLAQILINTAKYVHRYYLALKLELLLFLVSCQNQSTEIVIGQDTIINSSRLYSCSERLFLQ